ncbi:beta-ketoacyl synthase N-terminal-like domain-containing protein [Actinosynnema sp. NPDC091369]
MRGPSSALVAEQAGGLDAIGHARRTVRRGTPLVVTGGVDSAFDPWGWLSHLSSGRVSTATDPGRAYLPFDADARGYVPGEGGAMLVLERDSAARDRGAHRVYGEIAGYAATFDPPPGSPRPPGLRRAAELALVDAGLTPADVDVVFADAAGVPELDRVEADAITAVFGPRGVPVTAPKRLTGRFDVLPCLATSFADDPRDATDALRGQYAYLLGIGDPEHDFCCKMAVQLGFGQAVADLHGHLRAGDRAAAATCLPFEFIDATSLVGPVDRVAGRVAAGRLDIIRRAALALERSGRG